METYKYNNAIIHMNGEVDREELEDAAVRFFRKIHKHKKSKGGFVK